MPKSEIPKITLSKDEQDRLKRRLHEMEDRAILFRHSSEWSELHKSYWNAYLQVPKHKVRTFPFENASNLVMPMTQVAVHTVVAQLFEALLSSEPKVIGTESGDYSASQDLTDYYFSYYYKQVCNLQKLGASWLLSTVIDGTSATKVRQNRDFVVRREENLQQRLRESTAVNDIMSALAPDMPPQLEYETYRAETVTIDRNDYTDAELSDLERIYVAPESGPSLQWPICPWYYTETELSWEELVERRRQGYEVGEGLKAHLGRSDAAPKEETIRNSEGTSATEHPLTVRVLEFQMRWPLPARYQLAVDTETKVAGDTVTQKEGDEDGYAEDVVVTFAPEADELLRIMPLSRVTPDGKRPHVDARMHEIPGYFYGFGIPSKLRYIQDATDSTWNRNQDLLTLINIPWFFYTPAIGDLPSIVGIKPGTGIPVADPRGVVTPSFNVRPELHMSSMNVLQQWGEKLAMISDTMMGRNPSTPNAPRTARGMMVQVQQSQTAFGVLAALMSLPFIELFRRVHSFHKKYAPAETVFKVLNRQSDAFQRRSISWGAFQSDVDFRFEMNVNKQAESSQVQALFQVTTQGFQMAMGNPVFADSIRSMVGDIWSSVNRRNFDAIWPPDLIRNAQAAQAPPPPAPGAGGPPQGGPPQGGPPRMGPPGGQAPGPQPTPPGGIPPAGENPVVMQ